MAIDVETTGIAGPLYGHKIVEIGAVRFTLEDGIDSQREWSTRVYPCRPIPRDASEIHGIYAEHVATSPTFAEVAPALLEFIDGATLVMHNAPFDMRYLHGELLHAGLELPAAAALCTLKMAQSLFGRNHTSLQALATRLRLPVTQAHRALDDARQTARAFRALSRRADFREILRLGRCTLETSNPEPLDLLDDDINSLIGLRVSIERVARDQPIVGRLLGCAWGQFGSYYAIELSNGRRLTFRSDNVLTMDASY